MMRACLNKTPVLGIVTIQSVEAVSQALAFLPRQPPQGIDSRTASQPGGQQWPFCTSDATINVFTVGGSLSVNPPQFTSPWF